jgi:hypothetical protein
VPPEDGCLTPETCRGLRHNKVIVKVKVYLLAVFGSFTQQTIRFKDLRFLQHLV